MKKHSMLQRFSLLSLAAFLVVGLILGTIVTSSLEENVISRSKDETARFVADEVKRVFQGVDFSSPMTGSRYEDFNKGISHLEFNPSIKRIKVWNTDKVVVWSDERQLLGKRFPDDKELQEALGGTISSEILSPGKSEDENRTERQFSRLLELYIPIRSEHEGKVKAVFEIYKDLGSLDADISRQKRILWIAILAGFSVVYIACFGIVLRASRRLSEQTLEIEKSGEIQRNLARRLTSLVNNVPGIVYRGHRDWSLSFMGAEVESVTGYIPDEFTSGAVGWQEVIIPDDLERVKEAFRKAAKEKVATLRVEYRIRHKDGGVRWVADRRQMVYEENGAFAYVDGLLLDITAQKEADRGLEESEYRFRAIADTATDGIVTADAQGRIVFFNQAAERAFGYTFADVAGKNIAMLMPERHRSAHQGGMDRFLKTKAPRIIGKTVELEGLRKDGAEFPIELSLATWESKEGVVFSAIIRDITERMNRERALKESEEQLRVIFEGSKDGILLADVESKRLITGNRAICDMLQYSLDEIGRLGVTDIHPEEDLPWILDGFERQARQEMGSAKDLPLKKKDGSVLFTDLRSTLVTVAGRKCLLGNFRDVTERRKTEEGLTRLGMAVDQAAEGIVITNAKGGIEYINPSFERMTGYPREEAVGRNMRILKSGKQDEMFYKDMWETISRGEVWRGRFINRKKDGTLYEEEAVISPVRNASGKIIHFVAGKRDVTRDVVLQKQVQTAQRMESVGTLAGGIAHDFNNALTGIMGFGELMRLRLAGDSKSAADLDEILRCAERAATLTRQLLTFARRQVIEPVNLSLNAVVVDLMKLISKVAGEHIEVKTVLAKDLKTAYADQAQLEQVLMNLCLNARDAMPEGGTLLVETEDVFFREEDIGLYPYLKVGRYASLSVSDTGVGMDEKTLEKVFEPFFTTKGPDKGTGLGLAMVYGIVKQHDGFIQAESKPGRGATFKVYFPAVEVSPDAVARKRQEGGLKRGTETILLAEDEETIRSLAERVLKEFGYTVLVARNGEEAIEAFRMNKGVSLAILDVVMPKLGGMEAFKAMQEERPGLKVVFTSGYSADAIHESFMTAPGVQFLPKPYTPSTLVRKVREFLDSV